MTPLNDMPSNLFRVILFIPILYFGYLAFFSDLGVDPAKKLNHWAGELGIYYIILNLFIGYMISIKFKWLSRIRFVLVNRRFLGIFSFFLICAHIFFYFVMESFEAKSVEQLYTKTYLIFALSAYLILFVLAITSNDLSVRFLGAKNWKRVHRSVYVASLFFIAHVMLIEKTDLVKYGLIFLILTALQVTRLINVFRKDRRAS